MSSSFPSEKWNGVQLEYDQVYYVETCSLPHLANKLFQSKVDILARKGDRASALIVAE
jgi:hypothetical protein